MFLIKSHLQILTHSLRFDHQSLIALRPQIHSLLKILNLFDVLCPQWQLSFYPLVESYVKKVLSSKGFLFK